MTVLTEFAAGTILTKIETIQLLSGSYTPPSNPIIRLGVLLSGDVSGVEPVMGLNADAQYIVGMTYETAESLNPPELVVTTNIGTTTLYPDASGSGSPTTWDGVGEYAGSPFSPETWAQARAGLDSAGTGDPVVYDYDEYDDIVAVKLELTSFGGGVTWGALNRGMFLFDATPIVGETVLSTKLRVHGGTYSYVDDGATTPTGSDQTVQVVSLDPASDTMGTDADWYITNYGSTVYASTSISSSIVQTPYVWEEFEFNASGISFVQSALGA